MSTDFVLGFISGEGCFTIKRVTANGGIYLSPVFQLRVKEIDKVAIDDAYNEFSNIGTTRSADSDMYNWRIENKGDCLKLVEIIEDVAPDIWWRTEKGKNFKAWAEIVRIHSGGPTNAEQRVEMARLARDGLNRNASNAKSEEDWDELIDIFKEQTKGNY